MEELGEKETKVRYYNIEKQIYRNYLNEGMYMWQASMHFRNKNKQQGVLGYSTE